MSLKKDKVKVLGERFDDERIRTFLDVGNVSPLNPDFCALERAYRGMVAENFATFVGFFVAAGKDINAKNEEGLTFLQLISQHRHAEEYAQAMIAHGAK